MEKSNLHRLLHRYITGQVSEQERIKIEAWLDVRKTDEGTNLVLDDADEERLFRKITSRMDTVEEVIAFRPKQGKVRILFSSRWFQIAATLLLLVAGSYTTWFIVNKPAVFQTIARQEIEKVILNDGSIVWLEEGSKLTYYQKREGVRQAALVGEALFEVAKDPERPFAISCGEVTVKVVGTSFSLKTGEEGIELKVLTGKVNLSSATDKAGVDVAPNEKVIYSFSGGIKRRPLDQVEVSAITERTEYDMEFKNTTMESVIQKIEKKFNVAVIAENKQLKTCRITADFTDHSLESTLSMIAELLQIDYSIKRSTVTITGNGCN